MSSTPSPGSSRPNALGEYLRARRGLITPQQAGIPDAGSRRVPGLRREEVAMLAGISADYYLRLERGRDRNPSVQVLDALARVLQLDETHVAHLRGLACEQPRRRRSRPRPETVPAGTLTLLATLPHPAYVEGRRFDVLAANPLAAALSPRLVPGRNLLRDMFLDPADEALFPDWEGSTACLIANLRRSVGTDIDDPRFIELVGELSLASPRFRDLWARHDVKEQFGAPIRFDHPQVGELTLHRERLEIAGTDRLTLTIYHPEPGTPHADKLALLASAALPAVGSASAPQVRA